MLAMQMSIRLGADRNSTVVHECVSRCARHLGRRRDLVHTSGLIDDAAHLYSPFYVWRNVGAMREFLLGNPFTGVVETCGRPRLRTWNVLEFDEVDAATVPTFALREIDAVDSEPCLSFIARREGERHREVLGAPGLCARATMLDPARWEIARFSLWRDEDCVPPSDADCVHGYRVAPFSRADEANG